MDGEVHGAHVERREFRLDAQCGREPLIQGHVHTAAGRNVDHRVRSRLDDGEKLQVDGRVATRFPGLGITRVQMQNGSAGFCRLDGLTCNIFRRERQVRSTVGVWIAPVMAQLRITLLSMNALFLD